jgi:hypothetical protein
MRIKDEWVEIKNVKPSTARFLLSIFVDAFRAGGGASKLPDEATLARKLREALPPGIVRRDAPLPKQIEGCTEGTFVYRAAARAGAAAAASTAADSLVSWAEFDGARTTWRLRGMPLFLVRDRDVAPDDDTGTTAVITERLMDAVERQFFVDDEGQRRAPCSVRGIRELRRGDLCAEDVVWMRAFLDRSVTPGIYVADIGSASGTTADLERVAVRLPHNGVLDAVTASVYDAVMHAAPDGTTARWDDSVGLTCLLSVYAHEALGTGSRGGGVTDNCETLLAKVLRLAVKLPAAAAAAAPAPAKKARAPAPAPAPKPGPSAAASKDAKKAAAGGGKPRPAAGAAGGAKRDGGSAGAGAGDGDGDGDDDDVKIVAPPSGKPAAAAKRPAAAKAAAPAAGKRAAAVEINLASSPEPHDAVPSSQTPPLPPGGAAGAGGGGGRKRRSRSPAQGASAPKKAKVGDDGESGPQSTYSSIVGLRNPIERVYSRALQEEGMGPFVANILAVLFGRCEANLDVGVVGAWDIWNGALALTGVPKTTNFKADQDAFRVLETRLCATIVEYAEKVSDSCLRGSKWLAFGVETPHTGLEKSARDRLRNVIVRPVERLEREGDHEPAKLMLVTQMCSLVARACFRVTPAHGSGGEMSPAADSLCEAVCTVAERLDVCITKMLDGWFDARTGLQTTDLVHALAAAGPDSSPERLVWMRAYQRAVWIAGVILWDGIRCHETDRRCVRVELPVPPEATMLTDMGHGESCTVETIDSTPLVECLARGIVCGALPARAHHRLAERRSARIDRVVRTIVGIVTGATSASPVSASIFAAMSGVIEAVFSEAPTGIVQRALSQGLDSDPDRDRELSRPRSRSRSRAPPLLYCTLCRAAGIECRGMDPEEVEDRAFCEFGDKPHATCGGENGMQETLSHVTRNCTQAAKCGKVWICGVHWAEHRRVCHGEEVADVEEGSSSS